MDHGLYGVTPKSFPRNRESTLPGGEHLDPRFREGDGGRIFRTECCRPIVLQQPCAIGLFASDKKTPSADKRAGNPPCASSALISTLAVVSFQFKSAPERCLARSNSRYRRGYNNGGMAPAESAKQAYADLPGKPNAFRTSRGKAAPCTAELGARARPGKEFI